MTSGYVYFMKSGVDFLLYVTFMHSPVMSPILLTLRNALIVVLFTHNNAHSFQIDVVSTYSFFTGSSFSETQPYFFAYCQIFIARPSTHKAAYARAIRNTLF